MDIKILLIVLLSIVAYAAEGTKLESSSAPGADSVNDIMIDWGTGTNQVSLDDVTDGTSYEKVAAAELASGIYKDASTSVKGIASFNSTNFSVSSGAANLNATIQAAMLGAISGANAIYASTISVTFATGAGLCKDKYWQITTAVTDTVSVFANGSFTYGYVDYSEIASGDTLAAADIVWSTTAPAFSTTYGQWMNGDDRILCSIWCDSAGTIQKFTCNAENKYIYYTAADYNRYYQFVTNGNPANWVTYDASTKIPINAISVFIQIEGTDTDSATAVFAGFNEQGDYPILICDTGYAGTSRAVGWIPMIRGSTRVIKYFSPTDDDDASIQGLLVGYQLER